jgi:esterase
MTGSSTSESSSSSSSSSHTIVFLHGLLGNGRNLKTFAKLFCERQQAAGLLIDLPGHGKSKGRKTDDSRNPVTFDDCVLDLQQTLQAVGIVSSPSLSSHTSTEKKFTLVGHSMGGRVALHYADTVRNGVGPFPTRLVLLDTIPGTPHTSVAHVLGVAQHILLSLAATTTEAPTRQELTKQLVQDHAIELGTAQWLASMFDTRRRDFAFDLQVAQGLLRQLACGREFLDRLERILTRQPSSLGLVDLVRGGKNEGWMADSVLPHLERIEALAQMPPKMHDRAAFRVHVLPDAGHWVHVDDLSGLVDALDDKMTPTSM